VKLLKKRAMKVGIPNSDAKFIWDEMQRQDAARASKKSSRSMAHRQDEFVVAC
jgi:hypothetical protein